MEPECVSLYISFAQTTDLLHAHWHKDQYLCACTLSCLTIFLLLRTFAIQHLLAVSSIKCFQKETIFQIALKKHFNHLRN